MAVFLLIAFSIAVPLFILATPNRPVGQVILFLLLGSFAPTIAGLIVLAFQRNPQQSETFRRSLLAWRVSTKWYFLASLIPTLIWLGVILARSLLGQPLPQMQWSALFAFPLIFLINLGEEIGWRGFALPRLLTRSRPLPASLGLGLIWGLFHAALYWQRPLFLLLFIMLALGLSLILTWFYLQTGAVLICTLFHAIFNAWSQAILPANSSEAMLAAVCLAAWITALVVVIRYGKNLAIATPHPLST